MQENIIRFQVAMNNILGMQVVHALRRLSRDLNVREQLELGLEHVQVLVEAGALAPLRDYREHSFAHAPHEQQYVDMPRLAQHGHFIFKSLQLIGGRFLDVQV